MKWVEFEPAHARAYRHPDNVGFAPEGKTLNAMLLSGEIDVAIGATAQTSDVWPLFEDATSAATAWYRGTGVYPINHMVVVQMDLVRNHPDLMRAIYDTFKTARQRYVDFLSGDGPFPEQDLAWRLQADIVGGDPLPDGICANRRAIEHAAQLAYEQHITPKIFQLEELFEPDVLTFT